MKGFIRETEIEQALRQPFSMRGATVQQEDRPTKIVYSTRVPAEFSDEIAEAADAANVTPSHMIALLVGEALKARRLASAQTVTVDLGALHRAIDAAARAA